MAFSVTPQETLLRSLFMAGLHAASPELCLAPHVPAPAAGRTIVVGAGKAAGSMALAFEKRWTGDRLEGLVVTRYGHACPTRKIEVVEAAHPVPDAAGRQAAERMLAMVQGLSADDLVVCLISGGGSALLALPAPGISFEAKRDINMQLLLCGADIGEINCVRKHLSAIKGGRLAAAAAPARVLTLAISDVVGNDPATIASGPTVPDPSTLAMARDIVARYKLACPPEIAARLADPAAETPKPGDPRLARAEYRLIGSPVASLEAAAALAADAGYKVVNLGDGIEGDAHDVAREQAEMALAAKRRGIKTCILSGGETTVQVKGSGRGGRNTEYLLAFTLALAGEPGIFALACDTDGIDGTEDNAGAFYVPDHWDQAQSLGLSPADYLTNNDAYGFFQAIDALVETGPTLTNVNDFRAILVDPA
ncbi:MAG: glycerate kinase [Rhodospirillaceae bacterium]